MSEENKFIDALKTLIQGKSVNLYDGTTITLDSVHYARLPAVVYDNTHVVLVPRGPQFPTGSLGKGALMKGRERYVRVDVLIFHDGVDEESVIKTISDLTYEVADTIFEANRLRIAGSTWCDIGEISYDWASAEEQDSNTLTVTSLAIIPIVALYGR